MFEVGFWELALIAVIALLVVGPHRLPALARTVGIYVGKFRRYADHVRREIEREVNAADMKAALDKPALSNEIGGALKETKEALSEAGEELKRLDSPALADAGDPTSDARGAATDEAQNPSPPPPTPAPQTQEEDGGKGP